MQTATRVDLSIFFKVKQDKVSIIGPFVLKMIEIEESYEENKFFCHCKLKGAVLDLVQDEILLAIY